MIITSNLKDDPKMGHLMLDLETMGKKSKSAIVSISAVEFDMKTAKIGKKFYERVDLQSCLDRGLIVDASTIYWWLMQSEAARKEICKNSNDLPSVLMKLNTFMMCLENDFQMWGNGARFDIGILEDAYVACDIKGRWNFRTERDVRTLVSFAPEIKENLPFSGTEHNAVDDCIHQIKYCSAIWNKFNYNTDPIK